MIRYFNGFMRGTAVGLGAFALLNSVISLFNSSFNANWWWIHGYSISGVFLSLIILWASGVIFTRKFLNTEKTGWRVFVALPLGAISFLTLANSFSFYYLWWSGQFRPSIFIPLSLGIFIVSSYELYRALSDKNETSLPVISLVAGVGAFAILFPLAQVYMFGKSDYARKTDAVIVLGARVYADGTPSDALKDRVKTAVNLYKRGLARFIIMSGGPGDGSVHETLAMKTMAMKLGVPENVIIRDEKGLNTSGTVVGVQEIMKKYEIRTLLAVSHFYHLPRIKLEFARKSINVYTVPAKETYNLTKLHLYVAREIPALMFYWIKPVFKF
ncbi:YdcF family protein [Myxococcota bacterium]|nr:YdcF family protein [Myxococcota bacterium]MBU1382705.1 YdcF family protein [Myxococcota bacterium]MBU1497867.1 YdcF family protein [Myxococcota bacterium]